MQELVEGVEEICPAHTPQQDTKQLRGGKEKQHLVNSSPGAVRELKKPHSDPQIPSKTKLCKHNHSTDQLQSDELSHCTQTKDLISTAF